jgi:hypothetical protein
MCIIEKLKNACGRSAVRDGRSNDASSFIVYSTSELYTYVRRILLRFARVAFFISFGDNECKSELLNARDV